ncbi:GLPGLI family protein [Psychroserpens damuponensis]|uniref:GLPGLI family protein n=1 Tax=Psychroserpens damuponensis TaxID=943936 RepID=UPI00058DE241|nr:GLPGLI family protein [Psychroserpens damuponensis]
MKYFIYIVFFCQFFGHGQDNDSIPIFEYEVNYNLGKALVKKGFVFEYNSNVYYNTSKTEFIENIEKLTTDGNTGVPNVNLFSAGDGTENNVSLFKEKIHLDTYSLGNDVLLTDEMLQMQKWVSTGHMKLVNGRNCAEMVSGFRGRDYIAYVDLTIPVKFGPWKFNSFPGLPILIYDTENKLQWTLTEIRKKSYGNILNFIEEQESYLNSLKKMTLREYVKLYDDTDHGHTLMVSKLSRDYKRENGRKKMKREGFELKFEWETVD